MDIEMMIQSTLFFYAGEFVGNHFPIPRLGTSKQKKREEKREQTIARLEEELDKGNLNETENSHLEGEIKAQKHQLEKITEDRFE